jgi:hypothetical protein
LELHFIALRARRKLEGLFIKLLPTHGYATVEVDPTMSVSAQQQKIRRIVWTGAIAAVTATGAWYGAGLKTTSEIKQVCHVI